MSVRLSILKQKQWRPPGRTRVLTGSAQHDPSATAARNERRGFYFLLSLFSMAAIFSRPFRAGFGNFLSSVTVTMQSLLL